jgi:hypothetical protein
MIQQDRVVLGGNGFTGAEPPLPDARLEIVLVVSGPTPTVADFQYLTGDVPAAGIAE